MRVTFISSSMGDAFGLERVLGLEASELRRLGHEVRFLVDRIHGKEKDPFVDVVPGLTEVYLSTSLQKAREIHAEAMEAIRSFSPDVVHFSDLFDFRFMDEVTALYPSVLTAHTVSPTCPASHRYVSYGNGSCEKKSGFSCVWHHHSYGCLSFLKNDIHRLNAVANHVLRRSIVKEGVKEVIAISEYLRRTLILDGWAAGKIDVVYNPIATTDAEPLQGVPKNLIVCAARLVGLKGVRKLIEAASFIREEEWTIWICGDGPLLGTLKNDVSARGLQERVLFKGKIPYNEMQRIYASATVLAQPNEGPEGFGLSVAEALMQKCPVVAFAIPALDEIVLQEKTGLLVPAGDAESLAAALRRLIEDPRLRSRLGREGAKFVKEHFSLKQHIDLLLTVYERATGKTFTETENERSVA